MTDSQDSEHQDIIRVLHVDDEPDHLMFAKLFLEEADPALKVESISTSEEALQMLRQPFNCVVSDYLMPGMNGIELARKVKETSSIPFIIYTGRGSEEVAAEAFAAGVDDYVRKEIDPSHYQVLAKRIRAAVEKRWVEELYRSVVEGSRDAFTIVVGTTIVYANKAMSDLVDISSPMKLIGKDFTELLVEEDRERVGETAFRRQRGELPPPFYEITLRRLDGDLRRVEVFSSPISYKGKPAIFAFVRDVTDRIQYQDRLEALHTYASELGTAKTVEEVAKATFNAIEQALRFTIGSFSIVEGNLLRHILIRGIETEETFETPLEGPGITVRAVRTGETQLVPDVRLDRDYVPGPAEGMFEPLSELAVPVKSAGETVAIINLESTRLNAFTDEDRELLEIYAEHVAFAFRRIRLLEAENLHKVKRLRAIKDLKPGDHLCCLFKTEEEHRALLTPFLRQGLERGEKVIYIVDAHTVEVVLDYLRKDGLRVEPYLASGQLDILTFDDVYIREGILDPDRTIALIRAETERALAEGYTALRITDEVTWALREMPSSERLIEYEAKLNEFFPGSKCLAICQYDRRRFDPTMLLNILATHPIVVIGTEVYDNFFYIPPKEFLGPNFQAAKLRHWLDNLTVRKRAEEALSEYTHRLEEMVEERTRELLDGERMLAAGRVATMVSHDLRGSIQTIRNAVFLLRRSPEKMKEILDVVEKAVNQSVDMLEDIRSSTWKTPIKKETRNIAALIRRAVEEASPLTSIEVTLNLGDGLDAIPVYPMHMRRVLDNLIRNAVEAMPQGGVLTFTAERIDGKILIRISDTGIGIPDEEMPNLFKPFHTTKPQGLGLGLAYCKQAVEAHEGTITVESKVGEGTTFTVTIPAKRS